MRAFERVRALPADWVEFVLARLERALVEQLGRGTKLTLGPIAAPPADLPAHWATILSAADPADGIRALFAQGDPRLTRLGERLAAATTHVGLVSTKQGPRLVYIVVGPVDQFLFGHLLLGHPAAEAEAAARMPELAALFRVHAGLSDLNDDGVLPPSEWADAEDDWEYQEAKIDPEEAEMPDHLLKVGAPFGPTGLIAYEDGEPPRAWMLDIHAGDDEEMEISPVPDALCDLEARVEVLAGFWDDFAPQALSLEQPLARAKKVKDLSELPVGSVLVGRFEVDQDEDDMMIAIPEPPYRALLKVSKHGFRARRAKSAAEAVEGLALFAEALSEEDAGELLDGGKDWQSAKARFEVALPSDAPVMPGELAEGDVALLQKLVAAGGAQRVPAGRYRLKGSLAVQKPVELDGAGQVVLEAPAKGPALRFECEGHSALRGLAIVARDGTAVAIDRGSLEVSGACLRGESLESGRAGIRGEKTAKVRVTRSVVRGFQIAIDLVGEAEGELSDLWLLGGEQGVSAEGTAKIRAERVHCHGQTSVGFIAGDQAELDLAECESRRAGDVGFNAVNSALVRARDCFASDTFAAFHAADKGRVIGQRLVTERSSDHGVGASDNGRVEVEGWRSWRDTIGCLGLAEAELRVTGAEVNMPRRNGFQSQAKSKLEITKSRVLRPSWPGFVALESGDISLTGCSVASFDTGAEGVVARNAGRVVVRECFFEACGSGVSVELGGRATTRGCRFVRCDKWGLFRGDDQSHIDDEGSTVEQAAYGAKSWSDSAVPVSAPSVAVLTELLGATSDDPKLLEVLAAAGITKRAKLARGDMSTFLSNKKLGLELTFEDEGTLDSKTREYDEGALVLCNARVYGPGSKDFQPYAGELPHGLSFAHSVDAALKKVPKTPRMKSKKNKFVRWDFDSHSLFIDFGGKGIVTLCVQLPVED